MTSGRLRQVSHDLPSASFFPSRICVCAIRRLAAEKKVPLARGDGAGRLFGQPSSECTPPLPLAIPPTTYGRGQAADRVLSKASPSIPMLRDPRVRDPWNYCREIAIFLPDSLAITTHTIHGIQDNSVVASAVASALCAHPIKRQKLWVIYSRSSGPRFARSRAVF